MAYASTTDIQTTLDTQLQTVTSLPTFYAENSLTVQSGANTFCRSTLGPAKSTILSLGGHKVIEQTGLYQVDIFTPVDYGYSQGRTIADDVINAFPPVPLTLASGDQLIILSAWSQPSSNDQSAFLMVPVLVQWVVRTLV